VAALLVFPSGLGAPPLGSEGTASVPAVMVATPVKVLFADSVATPAELLVMPIAPARTTSALPLWMS
jgi:hypothetical protein